MLEPVGSDTTVAKDKYFEEGQAALAMSAGSRSDQALMGLITLSDERSGAHGGLGIVSYVYICRAFAHHLEHRVQLAITIDLILVTAQQLSLVTRPD